MHVILPIGKYCTHTDPNARWPTFERQFKDDSDLKNKSELMITRYGIILC